MIETSKLGAAPAEVNGEPKLIISLQYSLTLSSCLQLLTCDGPVTCPDGEPIHQENRETGPTDPDMD